MHNRLKQFLTAENITQAQFSNTIGIGKANISHVLAGRNKPGYDFIRAIITGYPHLNINWLLLGTGKMYNMTSRPPQEIHPQESVLPFEHETPEDAFSLFDEDPQLEDRGESLPEAANTDAQGVINMDIKTFNSIKELVNNSQVPVKQRNVSKIIVLFDDGTYQEL